MASAISLFIFGPPQAILKTLEVDISTKEDDIRDWDTIRAQVEKHSKDRIKEDASDPNKYIVTLDDVVVLTFPNFCLDKDLNQLVPSNDLAQTLKKVVRAGKLLGRICLVFTIVDVLVIAEGIWRSLIDRSFLMFKIHAVVASILAILAFVFLMRASQGAALVNKARDKISWNKDRQRGFPEGILVVRRGSISWSGGALLTEKPSGAVIVSNEKKAFGSFHVTRKIKWINKNRITFIENPFRCFENDIFDSVFVKALGLMEHPIYRSVITLTNFIKMKEELVPYEKGIDDFYKENQDCVKTYHEIFKAVSATKDNKEPETKTGFAETFEKCLSEIKVYDKRWIESQHKNAIAQVIDHFLKNIIDSLDLLFDFEKFYQTRLINCIEQTRFKAAVLRLPTNSGDGNYLSMLSSQLDKVFTKESSNKRKSLIVRTMSNSLLEQQ